MTPRRPARAGSAADGDRASADDALVALGLRRGEQVRFRRRANERWKDARVERVEADGSIGLRDAKGSLRALPIEAVEVPATGPRGGSGWEPLAERIARMEQLRLL